MLDNSISLTARSLWLRCLPGDVKVNKDFWADIVLYAKANPGKSLFFEKLIRQVSFKEDENDCLKLPLPLLVDDLVKAESGFTEDIWEEIINEWSQMKISLKIKAQTALLRNDDTIKKLLLAIFGKSKNPRAIIRQIAKESGLLRDYPKNDVIMMLCNIVAESLKGQTEMKKGDCMREGIFQMDEDDENMVAKQMLTEDAPAVKPARCSFAPQGEGNELQVLWEIFLAELAQITALDEHWADTDSYVNEVQDIAGRKIEEREAIIKRRTLIGEFASKSQYIDDAFRLQLNDMDISLPTADMADLLANSSLEYCIETFTSMQNVLQRYKELSVAKKGNLIEEKKRIGQLFTVITDIENLVARFSEVTSNLVLSKQDAVQGAAEPLEITSPEQQAVTSQKEEAPAAQQTKEDEAQIELFMGKQEP